MRSSMRSNAGLGLMKKDTLTITLLQPKDLPLVENANVARARTAAESAHYPTTSYVRTMTQIKLDTRLT